MRTNSIDWWRGAIYLMRKGRYEDDEKIEPWTGCNRFEGWSTRIYEVPKRR